MTEVRRATAGDASELVRLRSVMLTSVGGLDPVPDGPWQETAVETLRMRVAEPDGSLAAFVVDKPGITGGLASCVVGVIESPLADPDTMTGEMGYVFNVATDVDYRRRGYSRACMLALLAWYQQHDVAVVDLRASVEGEPLYLELGFVRTSSPTMRLTVFPRQSRKNVPGPR
jgi:ribosomal protein S18 acetylase RimI-like enzyme